MNKKIIEELEKIDGLYYEVESDVPITGTVHDYWDNGELRGVYEIKDGKFHGDHKIYWDNGQLSNYLKYEDGVPYGHHYGYWKDGRQTVV